MARLGESDIGSDGSFKVLVPPNTPVRFQMLDKYGRSLAAPNGDNTSEPLWIQGRPGEARVCGGCHEDRTKSIQLTPGSSLLQATTVLKGWTRVYHGAITENCTPLEVSNQIIGRAKKARGLAMADVPGFDPDYLGIVVFASTGLRPSPGIGLGGRYYIVCTDTLDDIPEPEYASMVADVSERDAIILTSARPIVVEQDEDEDDTDENTESK
jgi:hypothetical protein